MNKWTLALAAAGIVSMAAVATAEEAEEQVLTAVSGTTISGYVDTSMNWQFGDYKTSAGRSWESDATTQNGFNLNAVKIGIGKALEDDASTWSAGYQADMVYGTRNEYFASVGGAESLAFQNAYVDLRTPIGNGLDFRFGVFQTIIGYESDDTYLNPNFSHSYGYRIEPTQHVGALASYHFDLNDWILGVQAGIANTYDSQALNERSSLAGNTTTRFAYMGALNLIFPESTGFLEGTEIYAGIVTGVDRNDHVVGAQRELSNTANYYAGITLPLPVTGLRVGFAYDYRHKGSDQLYMPLPAGKTGGNWAAAYALYLAYDVTEKLTLANRLEYANGEAGTWTVNNSPLPVAVPRFNEEDEFLSDTITLSYKLWENVITRAEFRWDHDCSNNKRMADTPGRCDNALGITGNICYVF